MSVLETIHQLFHLLAEPLPVGDHSDERKDLPVISNNSPAAFLPDEYPRSESYSRRSTFALNLMPEFEADSSFWVRRAPDRYPLFLLGEPQRRDRAEHDRMQTLNGALEAWRTNPLARRIVELTSQYVVGGGVEVNCSHEPTRLFIQRFWNHPLNRMSARLYEWCDELTRSGELFILISHDSTGMCYLRAIPPVDIVDIQCASNDLEQETGYVDSTGRYFPGFFAAEVERSQNLIKNEKKNPGEATISPVFMLHYTINKPTGALRGESDLAPVLRWLARYSAWLEDRVRLNRYRFAFLYSVTMKGSSELQRRKRQAEMNANPPGPGSILVKDESEEWETISPKLDALEAGEDGLTLKKMIAAGSGIPLHFLAEPESATRTTAELAGGPTFRRFEQRQRYFLWMVEDIIRSALRLASTHGENVDVTAEIRVKGADISLRDNALLAGAAASAVDAFGRLYELNLIDREEYLRIVYRFSGEVVDAPSALDCKK